MIIECPDCKEPMEDRGGVVLLSESVMITLYQCPKCKRAILETQSAE